MLAIGNLATHVRTDHPEKYKAGMRGEDIRTGPSKTTSGEGSHSTTQSTTLASARLMEGFLREGVLNPAVVPTQKGFQRIFAAWILEDDLPFTTGESPALARLFEYLKVNMVLPSDKTVRNTLARIFVDLHGAVVRELTVSGAVYLCTGNVS